MSSSTVYRAKVLAFLAHQLMYDHTLPPHGCYVLIDPCMRYIVRYVSIAIKIAQVQAVTSYYLIIMS